MADLNPTTADLFPQVMLYIGCRKLEGVELHSKADPVVEVFEKISHEGQWVSIGHSELQWDSLDSDFSKSFLLDFQFEEQKFLKFKLWDSSNQEDPLKEATFISEAECSLGEIVGSPGQQLVRTMRTPEDPEGKANLILRVEELLSCKQIAHFRVQTMDLKTGYFPFLNIYKTTDSQEIVKIHTTESAKGRNPYWDIQIPVNVLCDANYDRALQFEIMYQKNNSESLELIGLAETCLKNITEGQNSCDLHLGPEDEQFRGKIIIENLDFVRIDTFLDYVAGGCQINLMMAIDFTASNGHPSRPDSLHRMDPNSFNVYEKAIYSVGEILLNYDSDKEVPMLGYGGKVNGIVNHCFPINFDPANPDVEGLDNMLMTYRESLTKVELSGPTLFSQVIERIVTQAESAAVSQENQQYFVLLIITDGEINDMKKTIYWIVRGSYAPVSIIIVGVGNQCNFSNMDILDGDKYDLVDSNGMRADRDIVQFVPFRDVLPSQLTREVLDELPREILNFFHKRGIRPNPPLERPDVDLTKSTSMEFNFNLGTFCPKNLYQSLVGQECLDDSSLQEEGLSSDEEIPGRSNSVLSTTDPMLLGLPQMYLSREFSQGEESIADTLKKLNIRYPYI